MLRTSSGALHFYVNGIDQGPAATNIPTTVYGVVDMYGKCAQVCVVDDANRDLGKLVLIDRFSAQKCNIIIGELHVHVEYIKHDKAHSFLTEIFMPLKLRLVDQYDPHTVASIFIQINRNITKFAIKQFLGDNSIWGDVRFYINRNTFHHLKLQLRMNEK